MATDHDEGQSKALRVAIVGSGFGGIAAAVRLKQAGISSFTVFERSGDLGGVWNENTYPGVEVDNFAHWYSFSFRTYDYVNPPGPTGAEGVFERHGRHVRCTRTLPIRYCR